MTNKENIIYLVDKYGEAFLLALFFFGNGMAVLLAVVGV